MLCKEILLKIKKIIVISDGFMEDCLRITRRYYCINSNCTWHILRVKHFLENNYSLILVKVTIFQKDCKLGYAIGGESRKQESMTCKEWKVKATVWDILAKGKMIEYIEKLHGYNPHIFEYFLKNWTEEMIIMYGVTMNLTEDFIVEITSLPKGGINFIKETSISNATFKKFLKDDV